MRMRPWNLALVLCFFCAASVPAQDAARSAELRKLDFYVGRWNETGRMRDDPARPFKPIAGGETCSWAAGGFAVSCEEKTGGEGGGWEGVYILGYDAASGEYHVHGIEKPGSRLHAVGKLEGDRWVWHTDPAPDGSRLRYTFAPGSAGGRSLVVEVGSGESWAVIAEVTYSPRK